MDKSDQRGVGLVLLGAFIGGILTLSFFIFYYIPTMTSPAEDRTYTTCFQILDKTVIYVSGNEKINAIVNESSKIANDTQRLNKIAERITDNFAAGVWNNNSTWANQSLAMLNNSQRYAYNTAYNGYGQIYIVGVDESDRNLITDPNWLIYNKIGACRELSILFDTIAKKSGYSVRIMRTGNGDSFGTGATHWWNEVEINGVNKTFDLQYYGQIRYGVSKGDSWSGNRSDYTNNSDGFTQTQLCQNGGVWVTDIYGHKIEDVTSDYMPNIVCDK